MKKVFLILIASILCLICITVLIMEPKNKQSKNEIEKDKVDKYIIRPSDILFDYNNGNGPKIKVYITKDKKIVEMFLEEYIRGVVAAEMPAEFSLEALKAQAVAARTYAFSHMKEYGNEQCVLGEGADICDTVHCQVYVSKEERLNSWPINTRGELWNKITEAVMATDGEVLTFNGKLVLSPYYFSTSSGRTESAIDIFNIDVPYLKSVPSKGEEISPSFKSTRRMTYSELLKKLNQGYPKAGLTESKIKNQIKVLSVYEGGSVRNIKLGNLTITGVNFRKILDLDSDNFKIEFNSKNINIVCFGYGHDVGMSQWGANIMAKNGNGYVEILTHYYNGIKVEKMKY